MHHSNHSRPKNLEMYFKSTAGIQNNTFTEHFDGCKLNYRSRKTNMLLGTLAPNVVTRICLASCWGSFRFRILQINVLSLLLLLLQALLRLVLLRPLLPLLHIN